MTKRVLFPDLTTAQASSPFFIDEEGVGIWLATHDETVLNQGTPFESSRNAIHIPSEDRHAKKLEPSLINGFIEKAQTLGLNHLSYAEGYWTHQDTKLFQKEAVIIVWASHAVAEKALVALAQQILKKANQAAVALELKGVVHHIS